MRPDEIKTLAGSPAKLDALTGNMARRDFGDTLAWMLDSRED